MGSSRGMAVADVVVQNTIEPQEELTDLLLFGSSGEES